MKQATLNGWRLFTRNLLGIPILITAALCGLAVLLIQNGDGIGLGSGWLLSGDADGGRTVLSSIVASLITVVGLVFSVTIIVLQLNSSQFSPRVLRNFFSDRITQVTAGTLVGVVAYGLLVLRSISTGAQGEDPKTPQLAVAVAILLTLVSLLLLLLFIHHISQRIQASNIIAHISRQTMARVEALFPEPYGQPAGEDPERILSRWADSGEPQRVKPERPGFLLHVDIERAFKELSDQSSGTTRIHFCEPPGTLVTPNTVVAEVWSHRDPDKVESAVRRALPVGIERTMDADVNFGLRQLVDIAIKALSPSIHDPTTARTAIGYIGAVLESIASREASEPVRKVKGGEAVVACWTFDDHLVLVRELARYAQDSPEVLDEMDRALDGVAASAGNAGANGRVRSVKEIQEIIRA